MDEYKVVLIGGADGEAGTFSLLEEDRRCHLTFSYRGRRIEAEASDYFEALCQVRLLLAKEGLIPFCYGASVNVYPSGMGRDMAAGLKAYKMALGKHVRIQDLVHIFSAGPDVMPAHVSRQREFFEEWLKVPKNS